MILNCLVILTSSQEHFQQPNDSIEYQHRQLLALRVLTVSVSRRADPRKTHLATQPTPNAIAPLLSSAEGAVGSTQGWAARLRQTAISSSVRWSFALGIRHSV
jgi:hypothetical protein